MAVCDADGSVILGMGDLESVIFPRSAMKPLQSIALIELLKTLENIPEFSEAEVALICASHNGELLHTEAVRGLLGKFDISVDELVCGAHWSMHQETMVSQVRSMDKPHQVHNNCSGKHAGMLALAKYLDQGFSDYIKMDHPVQKFICNYISEISGIEDITYELDGCSAPTPFMSLENIARLFQKLASQDRPELNKVFDAMVEYPLLVGGSNNFDSIFINALKGMGITKVGGESVRGIALNTKNHGPIGLAIKILDGNLRAMPIVTMKLLEHLELLSDKEFHQLDQYRTKNLKNHNNLKIGKIEAYIDF